jgi:ubiquinone/menaquinone biosynthesis C-methylase UbiE
MTINGFFLLEIFITWIAIRVVGTSVYKKFADNLGLRGQEQVLDFGCGLGTVARYTAPQIPGGTMVCADISRQRLKQCQKSLNQYKNVECTDLSTNDNPFHEESFDVIYCHFVLHEIEDIELKNLLERMYRWLKNQGKLVFREPAKNSAKLHHIDITLQEMGFVRDSTLITDIPLMGNAIEGRYTKKENDDGVIWKGKK